MLVALTGGIAAGKSTIADMLRDRGAVIVDADVLAREVVEPGTPALAAISAEFGAGVLSPDGRLDRPQLARRVFGEPDALARLNAIVHPEVLRVSEQRFADAFRENPDAVVVYDVPLLTEARGREGFDLVVVARAPVDVRVERLVALRGMTTDEAAKRVRSQAGDAEREAIADVIVDTGSTLEHTQQQVDALWARLTEGRAS